MIPAATAAIRMQEPHNSTRRNAACQAQDVDGRTKGGIKADLRKGPQGIGDEHAHCGYDPDFVLLVEKPIGCEEGKREKGANEAKR